MRTVALGLVALCGLAAWAVATGSEDPSPIASSGQGYGATVVEVARSYLGVTESPLGSDRGEGIDEWLAFVGLPPGNKYCAAFVTFVLHRATAKVNTASPIQGGARAKGLMEQFQAAGRWVDAEAARAMVVPPGSVAVWDRSPNGDGPEGHTGVVVKDFGSVMHTVEANTAWNDVREQDREKSDPRFLGVGLLEPFTVKG